MHDADNTVEENDESGKKGDSGRIGEGVRNG